MLKLCLDCVASNNICKWLKVSRATFARVMARVSNVLVPRFYSRPLVIGGPNIIVEADESKFGRRKYHRGHRAEGVWVFGMVERTRARNFYCQVVDDRTGGTLISTMLRHIDTRSTINTDCWRGYNSVRAFFHGHGKVNHSRGFIDRETGVYTNRIEGNWSGLKRQVPYRCRTRQNVFIYLIRFMLLRNFGDEAFNELINLLF